jgi:hypothetical protein
LAKDRQKEILREIREMRKDLEGRLDKIEARIDSGGRREAASVSPSSVPSLPAKAVRPPTPVRSEPVPAPAPTPPSDHGPGVPGVDRPSGLVPPSPGSRERDVSVIVQPLSDLSLARVVERALAETEGVESSSLRELSGDSAVIDTRVDEGVSLIGSLRRKLPVAFDVTESDQGSFTIALAQPGESANGSPGKQTA